MDKIIQGDSLEVLKGLPDGIVHTCVTSPPYFGLRDYGMEGQMGLEETPEAYVQKMVEVFREVRRVLRDDGTVWLNLGDSYNAARDGGHAGGKKQADLARHKGIQRSGANVPGLKPKDLIGIPWRVAFALQADGWFLRQDIIWHKPNPMPESVTDRCTKAHEYIFLLSKSPRYYFDHETIKEPAVMNRWGGKKPMNINNSKDTANVFGGLTRDRDMMPETRNRRSVWHVTTKPYKGAHFATFPPDLIEPCILAGAPERCCSSCGSPHGRITSRGVDARKVDSSSLDRYGDGSAGVHRKVGGQYQKWLDANPLQTIGWEPTCKCEAGIVGGVVLDPFLGSGTTAAVAVKHGRQYIGCELNSEYIKLAEERIANVQKKLL